MSSPGEVHTGRIVVVLRVIDGKQVSGLTLFLALAFRYAPVAADWCSNPGGVSSMSDTLAGCSWDFDPSEVDGFSDQDMSRCVCCRASFLPETRTLRT